MEVVMPELETLTSKGTTMEKFVAEVEKIANDAEKKAEEALAKPTLPAPDPDTLGTGTVTAEPEPEPKPKPKVKSQEAWKDDDERTKVWNKYTATLEENGRLKGVIANLETKVETLQIENDDLKNRTISAKPVAMDTERLKNLADTFGVGDEGITNLTELIQSVAQKAAQDAVVGVQKDIGEVRAGVAKTAEQIEIESAQKYDAKLKAACFDAYDIGNSEEFKTWVSKKHLFNVFYPAHSGRDLETVLDILSEYKATLTPLPEEPAGDEPLSRVVEPPRSRGGRQRPADRKTYSTQEAEAFLREYANLPRGEYAKKASTPEGKAKLDALYEDILAAKQEGRFIGP
jgi:hypothetical protein